MTFKQAAFRLASMEVSKAKDWEYTVWATPSARRSAQKRAKIDLRAAQMRAARLLAASSARELPAVLRAEVQLLMQK